MPKIFSGTNAYIKAGEPYQRDVTYTQAMNHLSIAGAPDSGYKS